MENGGQTTPPAGGNEHPTSAAPWTGVEGTYTIGEGDNAVPWWNGIQEQPIREYMEAKQYANPEEAARAAWNANKLLVGKEDAIIPPGAEATPEQWGEFYQKLGRPEQSDAYDLKLPEGVAIPEEILAQTTPVAKEILFDLGATPEKAQKAYERWVEMERSYEQKMQEHQAVQNDKELDALVQKWEGEQNLKAMQAAGQRAVKALGLSNEKIEALEANLGSAAVVELMALIGSKAPEGTFVAGGTSGGDPNDPSQMTPTQAQAAIDKLQNDKTFQDAYTNKANPQHQEALQRMELLFKKASGK